MKKISLLVLALFSFYTLSAQDLGKFQPKDDAFKSKKLNDGIKKLYISSFNINFEIYKEAVDKKEAGGFGRSIKNAAKAKAAVGLATLEKDAIQSKADQLYKDFVDDMKSRGYEIISAEEAGNTDTYQGWKKATGPSVYETDMTGILSVVPTGYSYFYKDRNALSSTLAGFDKTPQSLSQELQDALVADVSLVYVFSAVGNDWNVGNQAKVKLYINYRLANLYNVTDENTSAGLTSLIDKNKQAVALNSYVSFTRGKLKIGGSAESQYSGFMKSDLEISGVLEKDKVVAYSKQTQATATLQNPIVMIRGDNYSETTKWLEPDGKKYAEGMYLAGSEFIKYHLNEVFE
ncbi:hypothetical protein [Marivirga harenae]|uniref:hypothetical protein n=1 Tax=Marivirga harenae TaxID=2010992 RepID=UPI0026DFDEA8|nr:hypothetical protein [Marivirga harenae]WKV12358.1 hypothetical protein Q3Y49_00705 [Marivirga harenae]